MNILGSRSFAHGVLQLFSSSHPPPPLRRVLEGQRGVALLAHMLARPPMDINLPTLFERVDGDAEAHFRRARFFLCSPPSFPNSQAPIRFGRREMGLKFERHH